MKRSARTRRLLHRSKELLQEQLKSERIDNQHETPTIIPEVIEVVDEVVEPSNVVVDENPDGGSDSKRQFKTKWIQNPLKEVDLV